MKAIGRNLIIEKIKEGTTKTKGGLLLTEGQREDIRYRQALVIEPGTDVIEVDAGDEIYYDKSSGFSIELKNKKYKVIKEKFKTIERDNSEFIIRTGSNIYITKNVILSFGSNIPNYLGIYG